VLPDESELDAVAERLRAAGLPAERTSHGLLAADPSGNRVLVRT
jgi:hypothetical protein